MPHAWPSAFDASPNAHGKLCISWGPMKLRPRNQGVDERVIGQPVAVEGVIDGGIAELEVGWRCILSPTGVDIEGIPRRDVVGEARKAAREVVRRRYSRSPVRSGMDSGSGMATSRHWWGG